MITYDYKALQRRLIKMGSNVKNYTPAMAKISVMMDKDILDHFQKEQAPNYNWIKSYRAQRENGKTLQDTRRLVQSLMPRHTAFEASVETPVEYGAIHNYGLKGMPERKFMWLSKSLQEWILKHIGAYTIGEVY